MQIEILRVGLGLADDALHDRAAARRHELGSDAVAARKRDLHELAQLRCRRNRSDDFAFLLGRFDDLVPVRRTWVVRNEGSALRQARKVNVIRINFFISALDKFADSYSDTLAT